MAKWDDQFVNQCNVRRAVILHGNVQDAFFDGGSTEGVPIVEFLRRKLRSLKDGGYENIVCWDMNSGARSFEGHAREELEAEIGEMNREHGGGETAPSSLDADLGLADAGGNPDLAASLNTPRKFFDAVLHRFRRGATSRLAPIAYVVDGADALFGNSSSLSEAERVELLQLASAVRDAPCSLDAQALNARGDVLVLVTPRLGLVPPRFYQDTAAVGCIAVPKPDRKAREEFLRLCVPMLRVKEVVMPGTADFDSLVDSLEGFTYRDMQQLVKMSRVEAEPLSYRRLIQLYKLGERKSPWEDLSRRRLAGLEDELKRSVKGQDHVVEKVTRVIKRAYLGLSGLQHSAKQQMPKGIFFFVGPTGVGKTEMAKSIARFLFGEEDACIRFDMSEYSAEQSDQRLVGAPPGYVGYEAGGQLTNAVRDRPFSVLLFDEIEKAHDRIFDKFLQILEDGRLTDGKGDTVSFSESVIIFTSNIGASEIRPDDPEVAQAFIKAVRTKFCDEMKRPEILNRIGFDNVIPFRFLQDETVQLKIAGLKLRPLVAKLKEKYNLTLEVENEEQALHDLLKGYDVSTGGRGVANMVDVKVIQPLSDWLFEYEPDELRGRTVIVRTNPATGRFRFMLKD